MVTAAFVTPAENLPDDVVRVVREVAEVGSFTWSSEPPDLLFARYEDMGSTELRRLRPLCRSGRTALLILTQAERAGCWQATRHLRPAAVVRTTEAARQLLTLVDFALYHRRRTVLPKLDGPRRPYLVRHGKRYETLDAGEFGYLTARGSSCDLHTAGRRYTVSASLSSVLTQLDDPDLCRVHRSYAVNRRFVHAYEGRYVYVRMGDAVAGLPCSEGYRGRLLNVFPRLSAD